MLPQDGAMIGLLLFCSVVSAFFPIHQESQSANRLGGVEYEASAKEIASKRSQENGDAPGILIYIAPFRSASRYQVRSSTQRRKPAVVIRDNQYQTFPGTAPSQPDSLAIDEDGTDYSYFSTFELGSKAEKMGLLIDTGSSVTWVMDDACKSGPCSIHNTFASSQSASAKTGGGPFSLDYGSGEVSGTYINDTIGFAGMKATIPIGLADKVSDDFQNYPFDGIIGLGRVPLSGAPTVTFLQAAASAKLFPAIVFGVNLQRHSDGSADGELNFGAPDTSKYHGDLNWTDTISDKSFWQIPADDFFVDGKSVGLNQQRTAIVDTGTSYLLIPPNDAKALFGAIKGATAAQSGYWNLPCDTKSDIQVVIGGVGYSISPKDYVGTTTSGSMCVSNIVGISGAGNDQTWLLGDTFLKNVYTVFDADKNRIGLGAKTGATKIGGGSSSSSTASSSSATSGSSSSASSAQATVTGGLSLPQAQTTASAGMLTTSGNGAAAASAASSTAPPTSGASRYFVGNSLALAAAVAAMMAFL